MKPMKLHFAQYPSNGFGAKSGQYYLIDIFGNTFDIVLRYDEIMKEHFYQIDDPEHLLKDCGYAIDEDYADSPIALIEKLNQLESLKITEW